MMEPFQVPPRHAKHGQTGIAILLTSLPQKGGTAYNPTLFILFPYAQKLIAKAQIDNEVFRSGPPLYCLSETVVC